MKRSTLFILTIAASMAISWGIAVDTEANVAFAATDTVAAPAPTPVDQAYAGQLLSLHNELRQKYNVPPLVWDSGVADSAQAWADKIAATGMKPPEHRQIESIGQNIVWGTSGAFTPQFLVDRWAREVDNYDLATNTCAAGKYCYHFTQMVWSTTTKLGCGKATTADGKTDFVVCDYNPRGNMVGQSPFKTLPSTTPKATAECEACGKKVQDLTAQVEKLKQEIAAASDQKIKDDVKIGLDILERVQNEREKCNARMAESLKERTQRMDQYVREEAERDDKYLKRIKKCVLSIQGVPHPDSVEWCFNVRDY
jgi:pathogenesis-related protein 1